MTYGHARWAIVSELQALYRLRCATVHEGEDAPTIDDVTFGRWLGIVQNALLFLGEAALQGRARTVEEVVASYEARLPGGQVV
jgi:hypothetical protein